jgi:tRNA-Thr(GGU) m(6)t(6)A37 methyltransferase TsaA
MLHLEPIGVIHTARVELESTPVQAAANLAEEGEVVLDERFRDGLDGLEGFSHVWLLTWLGRSEGAGDEVPMRQRSFLRPEGPDLGIFAIRGPRRPVPIGLSLVEVVGVTGATVRFRGVDVVDGTPLLDLKPYFPDADQPRSTVRAGWYDEITLPEGATPTSLRSEGDPQDG